MTDQGGILPNHAPWGFTVAANVSIEVTQERESLEAKHSSSPLRTPKRMDGGTGVWAVESIPPPEGRERLPSHTDAEP